MDNILMAEDVASLTIFQCRQCSRRLQVPIMQIGSSRNICGSCFQNSPDATDVTGNVELERMMAKLHFPCNYNEEGCTFHGLFYKTCEHEKRCRFKKRSCPFAYPKKCETDTNYSFDDVIAHIREQHSDSILTAKDELITIKNPSVRTPDLLYFIDFDGNYFLLRTAWKKDGYMVVYAFFRLLDNILSKTVKFVSDAFIAIPNKDLKINEFDMFQHSTRDTFTVDLSVLKRLKFEKEIKVFINVEDFPRHASGIGSFKKELLWWKCKHCANIANRANFCARCSMFTNCGCKKTCVNCNYSDYVKLIDFYASGIDSNFPCNSPDCPELIRGDKYDIHRNYHCIFKTHSCPSCKQRYYVGDMVKHLIEAHKNIINQKEFCIMKLNSAQTRVFNNDGNIFIQKYHLSANGQFYVQTVKITEPHWDNSYVWKVHMKKGNVGCKMTTSGNCTMDGSSVNVDASAYLEDGRLTFYPSVISHI